eukprot:gene34604-42683_t
MPISSIILSVVSGAGPSANSQHKQFERVNSSSTNLSLLASVANIAKRISPHILLEISTLATLLAHLESSCDLSPSSDPYQCIESTSCTPRDGNGQYSTIMSTTGQIYFAQSAEHKNIIAQPSELV